jgi:hypothetical protein
MRLLAIAMAALFVLPTAMPARATASAAEAQELKARLTPVGAERAGNKDGTIPAWSGGYTSSSPGYRASEPRADPFAPEKPLFSITASNVQQYADRLPEGAKLLFQRFRDYRMDVYPSHRTAALPAGVYESIFRNATRAHAAPAGIAFGVEGAAGGIPFPIPRNGFEAIWNHLLAFWGPARELHLNTYVVTGDGAMSLATSYRELADFPFYYPEATPQSFGGYYFKTLHIDDGPPAKVGEGYLTWQPIDTARHRFAAWRLLPGERRVRRGASLSYDIPDPDASGFQNLDEYYVYFGGPDRYDFRIIGKKEMVVPYNNNRLYGLSAHEILGPRYANPDDIRYELHRVWVIEGTLARGQHHVAPRRRLYIDEDTWFALYSDSWNEKGKLWKFGEGTTYLMPDVPALILGSEFVYDFELGGYVFSFSFDKDGYRVTAPHPAKMFSPEWLASQAVR